MTGLRVERGLLQMLVALACLVPLTVGTMGILHGPDWLKGVGADGPRDLDSHFRYLSGVFLGVGIAFASCIPRIEATGSRFRMLAAFVFLGGLSRLFSLAQVGTPSGGHQFGLVMELLVTPGLMLWQASYARRQGLANGAPPGRGNAP